MALTSEGNALTDEHRRRQAAVSAHLIGQLGQLWPRLNPRDVDGTRDAWLRSVITLVAQGYNTSAALAAAYLPAFRAAEGLAGAAPAVPLRALDLARVTAAQALLGPIGIKSRIALGIDPAEAVRLARTEALGAAQMHASNGGRALTLDTVHADPKAVGWARVASGSACAFCAMLASRGPVYRSEKTAAFRPHRHCHCTAEPTYSHSPDAWPPSSRHYENEWIAASTDAELDAVKTSPTRAGDRRKRGGDAARRQAFARYRAGEGLRPPPLEQLGRRPTKRERDALNAYRRHLYSQRTSGVANARRADALEAHAAKFRAKADARPAFTRAADLAEDAAKRARANTPAGRAAALEEERQAATAGARQAFQVERSPAEPPAHPTPAPAPVDPALEASAVHAGEQASRVEEARAAAGAELDDTGVPWRLTADYLEELEAAGDEQVDGLVSYLGERLDDDNPRELARWEDLELWLDYRQAYDDVVAQAGHVPDEQISAELAKLQRERGKAGLTHTAEEETALDEAAKTKAGRPSRRQVQEDYALYVEELYVRAQAGTNGHLLNAKGLKALAEGRLSARDLFAGDVRRVYRYGSEELLAFFEDNRRVQWSEFYAQRTGSQAFDHLIGRQQRLNAGLNRDRTALDLVANREA